jgi:hypothetical protein
MEQKIAKKPVMPFIVFMGFIAVSINSIFKGIDQHETWRIVTASAGGLIFISLTILLAVAVYKNNKTAARA